MALRACSEIENTRHTHTSSRRHSEASHTPSPQAARQKKKEHPPKKEENTFCLFCFDSVTYIPLHAARRAMAAAVPLPLGAATDFTCIPFSDPRHRTYRRHSGGITTSPSPRSTRKNKTKEREKAHKNSLVSSIPYPYSSVPSGVGSTSISTSVSTFSPTSC